MLCQNYETVTVAEYEAECRKTGGYEAIPDDCPVKLYLDVDVKSKYAYEGEDIQLYLEGDCIAVKNDIKKVLKSYLGEHYNEDQIYWGSSHGIVSDKGIEKFKISYRIIVNNIIAYKYAQRIIVDELNRNAPLICDDMEYYPNGMFDVCPYNNGMQIIRSPFTSKPNQNRPMKIVSGTFAMSCITACIPEDAILLEREKPVKAPRAPGAPGSVATSSKANRYIIENGMSLL